MAAENETRRNDSKEVITLTELDPIINSRYGDDYKVDDANRLTLPLSALKSLGNRFVVVPVAKLHKLMLYPQANWEKVRARMKMQYLAAGMDKKTVADKMVAEGEKTKLVDMPILRSKNKIQLRKLDVHALGLDEKKTNLIFVGYGESIEVLRADEHAVEEDEFDDFDDEFIDMLYD